MPKASRRGQAELLSTLGEGVRRAVECLIGASRGTIAQQRAAGVDICNRDLYLAATRVVMRCVVVLFAEARMLLPVSNSAYRQTYSLEGLRRQLDRRFSGGDKDRVCGEREAWPRLLGLFRLVYQGAADKALVLPPYGGGLFQPGNQQAEEGVFRALAALENPDNPLNDADIHRVLDLLTRVRDKANRGSGAARVETVVDFSSLSSESIGLLYEGLLDYELKQAESDDPVVCLKIGRQLALPLSRLEAMGDKEIKRLFEAFGKKKDNRHIGAGNGSAGREVAGEYGERYAFEESAVDKGDEYKAIRQRVNSWLIKAVDCANPVKRPDGKIPHAQQQYRESRQKQAEQLCVRLVFPGEFYLVRWGGGRKDGGAFYTHPQLAGPTVRRTLQPLAYNPVRSEVDPHTGLEDVVEWSPRTPEEILQIKVCDPAMGSSAFLVASLRYLTQALFESVYFHRRLFSRESGAVIQLTEKYPLEHSAQQVLPIPPVHQTFEEQLRVRLKRCVAERCIYGVDLDPLAVELGRVVLWVEIMDSGLPLDFMDNKLKVGNSLIGCWLDNVQEYPVMAWSREGGDKDLEKNKPHELREHYWINAKGIKQGDRFTRAIRKIKTDIVKPEILAEIGGRLEPNIKEENPAAPGHPDYSMLKQRMDLWCALWVWPGDQLDRAPTPKEFVKPVREVFALVEKIAARHRFFHWELEFPDVFNVRSMGFDAVLGNPPWEIRKPSSKEFFSNIDPLYRTYGKQEALGRQVGYFEGDAQLEANWIDYKAQFNNLSNWVRYAGHPFGDNYRIRKDGGKDYDFKTGLRVEASEQFFTCWQQARSRHKAYADKAHPYRYQGAADLNAYKLFLELGHALLKKNGSLGFVVPSGIYTDRGSRDLRRLFLDQCDWQWLFGFENRTGIFGIHRSFKFCPLIIRKGGKTRAIRSAFMHRDIDNWGRAEGCTLAYSREMVEKLSPFSKAILEIRSQKDLQVLQKLYANGVLLGDQSDRGWGIKYAREFDMTNDSSLFSERPRWEAEDYIADEYGHWLKGKWRPYRGRNHILRRPENLVLSRDHRQAIDTTDIEDIALPLYEGRMIGEFDFSEKGWVAGKGRRAQWRNIGFEEKAIEPQYLMHIDNYRSRLDKRGALGAIQGLKATFLAVGSATNSRSMFSAAIQNVPAGNAVPVLAGRSNLDTLVLTANLNSLVYDYILRNRLGGLNLNYFVLSESLLIKPGNKPVSMALAQISAQLCLCDNLFAPTWLALFEENPTLPFRFALTPHERSRLKAINEALVAYALNLEIEDFKYIVADTDYPVETLTDHFTRGLNPKGFWRIDKTLDPEIRHPILAVAAFSDLIDKGVDKFLGQNEGEGWMIPETLRLADYDLGHDQRARLPQLAASRLGPRFYGWQLEQDMATAWEECRRHANLIDTVFRLNSLYDNIQTNKP